jgi:hypothetical protein
LATITRFGPIVAVLRVDVDAFIEKLLDCRGVAFAGGFRQRLAPIGGAGRLSERDSGSEKKGNGPQQNPSCAGHQRYLILTGDTLRATEVL